ncbi:MAG TPA: carboxymuconolactone decarboxylase family protein [Marinilabiliaceae bacterium]|nr:carboxymuconolactone decarboxylase family protein [Marinilabiliaceae bacterium]
MKERLNYQKVAPEALKPMLELEKYVATSGLERSLYELVKTRASQINGCAYCLDMHTKDARKSGETEQRLYVLSAWRETSFYTPKERAALAWTEAVTQISEQGVSKELFEAASQHFEEKELVALTMAIVAINGWNRLAISFGTIPGSYQTT